MPFTVDPGNAGSVPTIDTSGLPPGSYVSTAPGKAKSASAAKRGDKVARKTAEQIASMTPEELEAARQAKLSRRPVVSRTQPDGTVVVKQGGRETVVALPGSPVAQTVAGQAMEAAARTELGAWHRCVAEAQAAAIAMDGPPYRVQGDNGREWWIAAPGGGAMAAAQSLLVSQAEQYRDDRAKLEMALMVALCFLFVQTSKTDPTPLFPTFEDAEDFVFGAHSRLFGIDSMRICAEIWVRYERFLKEVLPLGMEVEVTETAEAATVATTEGQ